MKYVFGMTKESQTAKQLFNSHQAVCPFCKSESNILNRVSGLMECQVSRCGGKWKPKEATEENLVKFCQFLAE